MIPDHETFFFEPDGWGQVRSDWSGQEEMVLQICRRLQRWSKDPDTKGPVLAVGNPRIDFILNCMQDLLGIGWNLKIKRDGSIWLRRPDQPDLSKEAVMKLQTRMRDEQLLKPSTRSFVARMETKVMTTTSWVNIYSVIQDGPDLRKRILAYRAGQADEPLLAPYIQVADPKETCEHTGLRLSEIWRYFRHTWSTPYQTVPGRSISLLIRDSSTPNHPVIGIAALGSSVVHSSSRDRQIGWQQDVFLEQVAADPNRRTASWILTTIERMICDVYILDFLGENVLRKIDTETPCMDVIQKLESLAQDEKARHQRNPETSRKSQDSTERFTDSDWEALAKTPLYRSKRAKLLASLLKIRLAFQECQFSSATRKSLKQALGIGAFRNALKSLVSRVKSERVGIDMMDIIVCGAIPPFNQVLGGKLVCMLMCSPELRKIYESRYGKSASIIASGLAGRRTVRKPTLACLSTTSLYGQRSSQYNRVRVPASDIEEGRDGKVAYLSSKKDSNRSEGFGTFHFRRETLAALKDWLTELESTGDKSLSKVNYIFGEGTSPKLRKLRDAITAAGLPGDDALRHQRSRIVYYIPLAENVGDFLLGFTQRPKWILPQKHPREVTMKIADFWHRRWFLPRIEKNEVLDRLSEDSLAYPVTHRARVKLPRLESDLQEEMDLF